MKAKYADIHSWKTASTYLPPRDFFQKKNLKDYFKKENDLRLSWGRNSQ